MSFTFGQTHPGQNVVRECDLCYLQLFLYGCLIVPLCVGQPSNMLLIFVNEHDKIRRLCLLSWFRRSSWPVMICRTYTDIYGETSVITGWAKCCSIPIFYYPTIIMFKQLQCNNVHILIRGKYCNRNTPKLQYFPLGTSRG